MTKIRFQRRQPIQIGRPLVKQAGITPSVYITSFSSRRNGQVIGPFDRVTVALPTVERCANMVVVVDLVGNLIQKAMVLMFGRVRNITRRTTDIRSAVGALYRITTLTYASGLMTATLRIQQGGIHAVVVQTEPKCICLLAVTAAVTVFHHRAELTLRQ